MPAAQSSSIFRLALLLAAPILLAACSSTQPAATPPTSQPTAAQPDHAALEALYAQRQMEAKMNFTQADVDFMTGMIGHHAQALIMSNLSPKNGANPEVQRLSARIINAQNDEIAAMQRWLRERGQPVPVVEVDGLNLIITMTDPDAEPSGDMGEMDHGEGEMDHAAMGHDMGGMDHGDMPMHDHSGMAGMLSPAQLEELAAARGAEFDRLFLTYMIQHHSGAVTMVDDLFAADGAANDEAAFKLASDINVDQKTEIARMYKMLGQLREAGSH